MRLKQMFLILLALSMLSPLLIQAQASDQPTPAATTATASSGLLLNTDAAYQGDTLFAPLSSDIVYLIDMQGQLVKSWKLDGETSLEAYLLPNGDLLAQVVPPGALESQFEAAGGAGGGLREYDWNGNLVWSFDYAGENYQQHHDIEPMPNGDILMIVWQAMPVAEAQAAGMRSDRLPDNASIWPDEIDELNPKTDQIVWKWRAWDHLIQDYDPSLPNYGVVSQHPERIDINYQKPAVLGDWLHTNSVSYNPALDQILISSRNFSEIWIIDHSTTTEEAATSSGGNSGMGGDLLYRWGNPAVSQTGSANDQQLFGQHDPHWITPGNPGAGDILIFDNGDAAHNRPYSTVLEIAPPLTTAGTYIRNDNRYAPAKIVWQYTADPPESLFAPYISSAQRFPNGNTLIADGIGGRFFEVNSSGEIVWNYINGFAGDLAPTGPFISTSVFRARRYPLDYPGLKALNESP